MSRTRTTFQPGHKGMGGRPKGSRNRAKEEWRVAQRLADEIGQTCDALIVELGKPERHAQMSARQRARLLKLITAREKSHLVRSQYVRPVGPPGDDIKGFNIVFHPWPPGLGPQTGAPAVPSEISSRATDTFDANVAHRSSQED